MAASYTCVRRSRADFEEKSKELAECVSVLLKADPHEYSKLYLGGIINNIKKAGHVPYFWDHFETDDIMTLMHPAVRHVMGACIYHVGPCDKINAKTQRDALASYWDKYKLDKKLMQRRVLELTAYEPKNPWDVYRPATYEPHRIHNVAKI